MEAKNVKEYNDRYGNGTDWISLGINIQSHPDSSDFTMKKMTVSSLF